MKERIVVVGGGVIGLCTALNLAELGCPNITLIERDSVGNASSSLSAGVLDTQFLDRPAIELRAIGHERFLQFEDRGSLRVTRNGYIRLTRLHEDVERFELSVKLQREFGIEAYCLSPAEILRVVPDLNVEGIEAGLHGPDDSFVDGYLLCSAYAQEAASRGVVIEPRTELLAATETPNGLELITSKGVLECGAVVNAAGAWAMGVGLLLNAPVPLVPQRHQIGILRLPEPLPYVMPTVMDYVPGSGEFGVYFRHESEQQMLAGLHTEERHLLAVEDPDAYRREVDGRFVERLAAAVAERLPALDYMGVAGGWAGLYPNSPDGPPIIGRHPLNPLVTVAAGVGSSGIQISPAVGRLAAEAVIYGEPTTIDASCYSPSRFVDQASAATLAHELTSRFAGQTHNQTRRS